MKEIEVLRLNGKKGFEEKVKRKFVTVKNKKKKISSSLRKDLYRNYGFKLEDN